MKEKNISKKEYELKIIIRQNNKISLQMDLQHCENIICRFET